MSNPEHVRILNLGSDEVEIWRERRREIFDCSGEDYSGADLSGYGLSNSDFSDTNLSSANLHGTSFSGSDLSGAKLDNATLVSAYFNGTNLSRASLVEARASPTTLFHATDLSYANLKGATFRGCKFLETNFRGCDWNGCDFANATFHECTLSSVLNAHLAINLHTVRSEGEFQDFESAERPWFNRWIDWETIKIVGRLPLFAASTTTLILLPIFFYFLELYNKQIFSLKNQPNKVQLPDGIREIIGSIHEIPLPSLSLYSFLAAILLLIGSALYLLCCPPLIKHFSRIEWCERERRPLVLYWPHA